MYKNILLWKKIIISILIVIGIIIGYMNIVHANSKLKVLKAVSSIFDIYQVTSFISDNNKEVQIYFSEDTAFKVIEDLKIYTSIIAQKNANFLKLNKNEQLYIAPPERIYQDDQGIKLYRAAYGINNNGELIPYGNFIISERYNKVYVLDILSLTINDKYKAMQSAMWLAVTTYLDFNNDWIVLMTNNPNTKLYSSHFNKYYRIKTFYDEKYYWHVMFQAFDK